MHLLSEHKIAFIFIWFASSFGSMYAIASLMEMYRNISGIRVWGTVQDAISETRLEAVFYSFCLSVFIVIAFILFILGANLLIESNDSFNEYCPKPWLFIHWAIVCMVFVGGDVFDGWQIVLYPAIAFLYVSSFIIIASGGVAIFYWEGKGFPWSFFFKSVSVLTVIVRIYVLKKRGI